MNSYRNNNRKNRYKHNGERNFRKRSISGHKNHSEFMNLISVDKFFDILKLYN